MKDTSISTRNLVIYQIFTRNYREGTFKAVEKDLDRICALGVDVIYLLPIQPSGEVHRKGSMGSPYAIKDYRAIDPVQGTMDDFKDLCRAAHDRSMKVMIDVVYNHTSPDSVLSKEHPEWFYHKPDGSFGNRVGDWWDVIDLDYSQPGLWDYQIETLKMWAEYVDGFRCDVAPMVPLEFWQEARARVEEVRPGCLWLAESVEPGFIQMSRIANIMALTDSELYQAFDIDYDYDIYREMTGAMTGDCTLKDYVRELNRQEVTYPANYNKLRCLENHDRPRAAALMPDRRVLRNWTALMYFCKGTVMLYAGQEFCVTHHPTLFDHDPVNFETGEDISDFLAGLKKNLDFSDAGQTAFEAGVTGKNDDIIYATLRSSGSFTDKGPVPGDFHAVGIFSNTGTPQAVHTDLPDGTYTNLVDMSPIDIYEGMLTYSGEPVVLVKQN